MIRCVRGRELGRGSSAIALDNGNNGRDAMHGFALLRYGFALLRYIDAA